MARSNTPYLHDLQGRTRLWLDSFDHAMKSLQACNVSVAQRLVSIALAWSLPFAVETSKLKYLIKYAQHACLLAVSED